VVDDTCCAYWVVYYIAFDLFRILGVVPITINLLLWFCKNKTYLHLTGFREHLFMWSFTLLACLFYGAIPYYVHLLSPDDDKENLMEHAGFWLAWAFFILLSLLVQCHLKSTARKLVDEIRDSVSESPQMSHCWASRASGTTHGTLSFSSRDATVALASRASPGTISFASRDAPVALASRASPTVSTPREEIKDTKVAVLQPTVTM